MKTAEMERIELRDWERRLEADPQARKRDIREIIQDAFVEGGKLEEAALILGVDIGTLSGWIRHRLNGAIISRVVFSDFVPAERLAA